MATLKLLNGKGRYRNEDAKENSIDYILRPDKAISGYIGGALVNPIMPAESMKIISEKFGKSDGIQLRHLVVSFLPGELDDVTVVNQIACCTAQFIGKEYQNVFAVHEDKEHLHFHIVFNSVSYINGYRYKGSREEYYSLYNAIKSILENFGIYKLQYVSNDFSQSYNLSSQ